MILDIQPDIIYQISSIKYHILIHIYGIYLRNMVLMDLFVGEWRTDIKNSCVRHNGGL